MIRFDDFNILSHKLVHLSFLISIPTESSISEEVSAATIVIAIISKTEKQYLQGKLDLVPLSCWNPFLMLKFTP